MADNKRPLSPDGEGNGNGSALVVKKQRTDALALADQRHTADGVKRTSSLLAPIMLLTGHAGEVFTVKFSPDGATLASGSHDKFIYLWRSYDECENYMMMKGHKNGVLELHWNTEGDRIISASPDKSVRAWDAATGQQVKKMGEHDNFVNSCAPLRRGPPLVVSGSDDGTAKLWDLRKKRSVATFTEQYQVLAVAFSDGGDAVYTGGLDNTVKVWDLRKEAVSMTLEGHTDSITGMAVSPDGSHLLTNAMDNTLRMWDLRPYAPVNRCVKVFDGHLHNYERNLLRCAWSPDGEKITAGSADRMVNVWDVATRRVLYRLPGHTGSVNEVSFHPSQPVLASASSDQRVYLGELNY